MYPITNLNQLTCFNQLESYSSDDEENSYGSNCSEDFVFDIISHSTNDTESEESIEEMPIKPLKDIIDCCTFSNHDLYLTSNYKIHLSGFPHKIISCNRKIIKLFVYNSDLYGLDKYGCLNLLLMHYYASNYWVFTPVNWSPKNIIHVSVTLDGLNLWLQTAKESYLYGCEESTSQINGEVYKSSKRIYGKNKDCYLEIKKNHCFIYIHNDHINTIPNVVDAVLDCHHTVHVTNNNDIVKHVRLLNHQPYYF